jgi:DNA-binding MarR family transcriptional regulator
VIIAANPGLKQSEVAEALGIQRANFVAIADGLESRGLAERRKSDLDRRVQALYLTKSGEALFEAIMTKWKRHEDSLIDRLGGAAARDQLLDLLSRIVD